jgi:hypothetical protein
LIQRVRWFLLFIPLLGATALMGLPSTAYAQASQHALPQVTCSGNGCNNLDPVQTGCAVGSYTVQTAILPTIFLQLRYSPTCKTNWGRVISRRSHNEIYLVLVERDDGLAYGSPGLVGPVAWSRMVYAPVAKAQACVSINGGNDLCTAFV